MGLFNSFLLQHSLFDKKFIWSAWLKFLKAIYTVWNRPDTLVLTKRAKWTKWTQNYLSSFPIFMVQLDSKRGRDELKKLDSKVQLWKFLFDIIKLNEHNYKDLDITSKQTIDSESWIAETLESHCKIRTKFPKVTLSWINIFRAIWHRFRIFIG